MRNHVYEDVSTKSADDRCCVLPCLALAHVCQQLRAEYLPICCKAPVTIFWKDLPRYLDIHASISSTVYNTESAPSTITIYANAYERRLDSELVSVDILPLVKMKHRHAGFSCQLLRNAVFDDEMDEGHDKEQIKRDQADVVAADETAMQSFMTNENPKWLSDVQSGKIIEVTVSPMGTEKEPELLIVIAHNEETYLEGNEYDNASSHSAKGAMRYLRGVDMEEDIKTRVKDTEYFAYVRVRRAAAL